MPATLLDDPPGISCVFSDGTTARFDLSGLPCPDLVGDLLAGLAELIHPHGTVDAAGSAGHYVPSIPDMARKPAGRGVHARGARPQRAHAAGALCARRLY